MHCGDVERNLDRRVARWIMCSGDGDDFLPQLQKASVEMNCDGEQQSNTQCILLHVDLLKLLNFDYQLGMCLLCGQFELLRKTIQHVIHMFLCSPLFCSSQLKLEKRWLTIRFDNMLGYPRSITSGDLVKSSADCPFRTFMGLIIRVLAAQEIRMGDTEVVSHVYQRQQIDIQLYSMVAKGSRTGDIAAFPQNQICAVYIERELVGNFFPGQIISGIGTLSVDVSSKKEVINQTTPLKTLGDWKRGHNMRCAYRLEANSVFVVPMLVEAKLRQQMFIETEPQTQRQLPTCKELDEKRFNTLLTWQHEIQRLGLSTGNRASNKHNYRGCRIGDWMITISILRAFGKGIVHSIAASYDKVKLMILLSLVSEPTALARKVAQLMSNVDVRKGYLGKRISVGGSIRAGSICSKQTSVSLNSANAEFDQNEVDDAISILFISDDVTLQRLLEWAFQIYPSRVRANLTVKDSGCAIPFGSLIFVQGNCLSKSAHARRLESMATTQTTLVSKTRSHSLWCLVPETGPGKPQEYLKRMCEKNVFHLVVKSSSDSVRFDNEDAQKQSARSFLDAFSPLLKDKAVKKEDSFIGNHFDKFTSSARCIKCRMTRQCCSLIKKFFIVCRLEKQYPMSYLGIIIRSARAHARMHLRSHVELIDGVVGIMIMEETRASIDGTSATLMKFRVTSRAPYAMQLDTLYDGESACSKFMAFYSHILSTVIRGGHNTDDIEN